MKPSLWISILIIACIKVTNTQGDDQSDSSFQDTLASFLKSLFGSSVTTDSSTEALATAVTGLPPAVTQNETAANSTQLPQGSTMSQIFNLTTKPSVDTATENALNLALNQTSNSTLNQSLNQTQTVNQTLNSTLNQTLNKTLNEGLDSTVNLTTTATVRPGTNSTSTDAFSPTSSESTMSTSTFPEYEDVYAGDEDLGDPACYEDALVQVQ